MSHSTGTIPFFDMRRHLEQFRSLYRQAIDEVFDHACFVDGPEVKAFERAAASYLGVFDSASLNSGSDGLHLVVRSLDLKPSDEVVVPSFSYIASASCVSAVGACPVFAEIEPDTFNVSRRTIESVLTDKTKAIIVVHIFGASAPMDEIMALARERNLIVIEDAAQAFGAECNGKKVGTIGDFGVFSFYPTKNLGAMGDGGLVVSQSTVKLDKVRSLKNHGSINKFESEINGFNSRLDTLQASLLIKRLQQMDDILDRRRQIALCYLKGLGGISGIGIQKVTPEDHSYNHFVLRLSSREQRDSLVAHLHGQGIGAAIYYPVPIHKLPVYAERQLNLPETEGLSQTVVSLPLFPELTDEEVARVIEVVRKWLCDNRIS